MITLLGATGYVGNAFQKELRSQGMEFDVLSRSQINYTDPAILRKYLKERKPEFLINCAGYTGKPNVDACEIDKANCLAGNASLPGIINDACVKAGIKWGHVSSGCIFSGNGTNGNGFKEADVPNFSFRHAPCSWYSGTKALGEEILGYSESIVESGTTEWTHNSDPTAYIWRLRIPFDHVDSPRNYISKLLRYTRLLEARNSLSHLGEFAKACLSCWTIGAPLGIYNVTNPGSITTREVVDIIKSHGLSDKEFSFFESDIDFYSKAAATPRSNCVLDSSKLTTVGVHMRPVREAIESAIERWESTNR